MMSTFNTGDVVRFVDACDITVKWGNNDDPRNVLRPGLSYNVLVVEVHSSHTKLYLEEFPHLKFNSVHFAHTTND